MDRRTVVVTGASRGIGKEIALAFAREKANLIITNSTNPEELKETAGEVRALTDGFCHCFTGDLGDPAKVRRMFGEIAVSCGGADVVINNAGISISGLITDVKDEDWDKILKSNLSSVFYCCRSAVPYMVKQKNGCIINITSVWGEKGATCEVAYSATKAGVNGLTRALARELAPSHIRVNAVAFGCIDTSMNDCYSEAEKKDLCEEIPVGRFASAAEAAEAVVKLSHMPEYLTGQIITVDGGWI